MGSQRDAGVVERTGKSGTPARPLVGLVARRWLRGERRVNPPAISPYPRYLVFQVHY